MEDLSETTRGSLIYGSMSATNTISKPVAYQPPGSPSESTLGTDVRPEMPPVPPQALNGDIAGTGRKGGIWHAEGADPGAAGPWTGAGQDSGRWTTARRPFNWTDI